MDDWITKLERAKRLLDAGALSKEEFDQEKARLLADAAIVDGPPKRRFRVPDFSNRLVPLALGGAAIVAALLGYFTWAYFIADVEMPDGPTSAVNSPNFEIGELPSDTDEPLVLPSAEDEIDATGDEALVERERSAIAKHDTPVDDGSGDEDYYFVDADGNLIERGATSGPQPLGNAGGRASPNDYPSRALREERSGTTGFRVTVDTSGRVIDCQITSSSGHADLDQATCQNVSRRARFKPATQNGEPVQGSYSNRVDWVIPD